MGGGLFEGRDCMGEGLYGCGYMRGWFVIFNIIFNVQRNVTEAIWGGRFRPHSNIKKKCIKKIGNGV